MAEEIKSYKEYKIGFKCNISDNYPKELANLDMYHYSEQFKNRIEYEGPFKTKRTAEKLHA